MGLIMEWYWLGTISRLLPAGKTGLARTSATSRGAGSSSGRCSRPPCLLGRALAESECGNAADGCGQEAAPGWAGCPPGEGAERTLHRAIAWAGPQAFLQITCSMGLPNECWDFPAGWGSLLLLNCSPKAEGTC